MSSLFHSVKRAEPKTYPIPDSLDRGYVTSLLHNESILSPVFWPSSITTIESKGPADTTINHPNPDVSVSMSKTRDGVVYREKMPGGFTMAITYTVIGANEMKEKSHARSRHYLLEERSVRALWPISGFIKFQHESPKKTQDLVKFLEVLARNGRDVPSALEVCAAE